MILAVLVVVSSLLTAIGVVLVEFERTDDLLTPLHLIWGFYVYFFLLSYLHMWVVGDAAFIHPFETPLSTATYAIFTVFIGMLSATFGYYLRLPVELGRKTNQQLPEHRIDPRQGQVLGLVLYSFGLLSTVVFVLKNGGFLELLSARDVFAFRTANNSLRYWIGLQLGLFGGTAMYVSGTRGRGSHWSVYVLTGGTAVLFMLMHTRIRAIFCGLLAGMYAWYSDERITNWRIAAIGSVLFFGMLAFRPLEVLAQGGTLNQVAGYMRYYLFQEVGGIFLYTHYLQGYMVVVAGVPEAVPYQWGRTIVGLPWVPGFRNVGSNPMQLTEIAIYGQDKPGVATSATGFGIMYLNFGVPGLIVGGLAAGVIMRWSYVVWKDNQSSVFLGAMYFIVYYYFFKSLGKTPILYNILLVLLMLRGLWEVTNLFSSPLFERAWKKSRSRLVLGNLQHVTADSNRFMVDTSVLQRHWEDSLVYRCTQRVRAALREVADWTDRHSN